MPTKTWVPPKLTVPPAAPPADISTVQEIVHNTVGNMLDSRIAELRTLVMGLKGQELSEVSAELTVTRGELKRWRIIGGSLGGFLAVLLTTSIAAWQTFDNVRRETVDTATEAKASAAVAGVQATTAKVDAMTVENRVQALERRSDRIEAKLDRVLDALEDRPVRKPKK